MSKCNLQRALRIERNLTDSMKELLDTGEITNAWIFVSVLTYSQYTFVKAYMNEKTGSWIKAHVQMFDFFGGVTPM